MLKRILLLIGFALITCLILSSFSYEAEANPDQDIQPGPVLAKDIHTFSEITQIQIPIPYMPSVALGHIPPVQMPSPDLHENKQNSGEIQTDNGYYENENYAVFMLLEFE